MDAVYPHLVGTDSPPSRQNILTSFLRGRPRGTSQSHTPTSPVIDRDWDSPPPSFPSSHLVASPPSPGPSSNRRRSNAAPGLQPSISHNLPISAGLTQILRRRRSGGRCTRILQYTPGALPSYHNPPTVQHACHAQRACPHLNRRYRTGSASCHTSTLDAPCALTRSLATSSRVTPHCESAALPNALDCPYPKPMRSTRTSLRSNQRSSPVPMLKSGANLVANFLSRIPRAALARFSITSASQLPLRTRAHSSSKTVTLSSSASTIKVVQKTYTNASVFVLR
jgi:hypothetical protein